ncbi:MAG TPA: alpha/beta fold hydrolase [Pirellulaceae bacterium]|nr:alpha/beta fold hydrolase [Pirellulaceae bacterium]HMO92773.1 alpha/beta fold hydrolase [Pirellulaceae bacterium]HMP69355.1 alpha/beta fold hydrolase [Pirellulaceae bacterium]
MAISEASQQPIPLPFESHFIELGGERLHFFDTGCGETILFVHGNPTWAFYWRDLITALSTDFRCVAIDHVGMGLSSKPQQYDYCLDTHIRNLVHFIETKELQNISLVAHDWGGAIGCGAATELPERFKRLILLNTAIFPPPFFPLRIRLTRTPLIGTLALRGFNLFCHAANRMATNQPGGLAKAVRRGLIAPYDTWHNRIGIQRFVQDIPTRPDQPTWQRLEAIEKSISLFSNHPVLLIWGMKDWCFRPECMYRIQKLLPHATSVPIADAGHYVVEDATEQVVNSLQRFLRET